MRIYTLYITSLSLHKVCLKLIPSCPSKTQSHPPDTSTPRHLKSILHDRYHSPLIRILSPATYISCPTSSTARSPLPPTRDTARNSNYQHPCSLVVTSVLSTRRVTRRNRRPCFQYIGTTLLLPPMRYVVKATLFLGHRANTLH